MYTLFRRSDDHSSSLNCSVYMYVVLFSRRSTTIVLLCTKVVCLEGPDHVHTAKTRTMVADLLNKQHYIHVHTTKSRTMVVVF